MKTPDRRALLASGVMGLAALMAHVLTPGFRMSQSRVPPVNLEATIPSQFGSWAVDRAAFAGVVNPQQAETIQRIYSQTLSRVYMDARGRRVMLSIAYGEDQRDAMAVHYPEVCYPAQGFEVLSNRAATLEVAGRRLPVRRLETRLGAQRLEPVTYWTTVGDDVSLGGMAKKRAELRYGLAGTVPDGLLFRVSSVGADSAAEFAVQAQFVADLLSHVDLTSRPWLAGRP